MGIKLDCSIYRVHLLCSEMYVPENTTQPAASWSSWLSPPIRDWCGAGEQFNRHLQGVVCWCTFWQASDMPKESQPPVADECTYIRQTCLFSNWWERGQSNYYMMTIIILSVATIIIMSVTSVHLSCLHCKPEPAAPNAESDVDSHHSNRKMVT